MANEDPEAREERLTHQEERLTHAHERRKEALSMAQAPPSGGTSGVATFVREHRMGVIIGVIATVVVGYFFWAKSQGTTNAASNASPTANQQGSLGNAGYQDQGTAYALTQLGQQLNNMQAQMSGTTSSTSSSPTATPTVFGSIWTLPGQSNWQVVGGSQGAGGIPLVPYGASSTPSGKTGELFHFNNQTFTQVAGSGGRIWGAVGNMSAQQAINSQTKVLLYAPQSYYRGSSSGGQMGGSPSDPVKLPMPVSLHQSMVNRPQTQFGGLVANGIGNIGMARIGNYTAERMPNWSNQQTATVNGMLYSSKAFRPGYIRSGEKMGAAPQGRISNA